MEERRRQSERAKDSDDDKETRHRGRERESVCVCVRESVRGDNDEEYEENKGNEGERKSEYGEEQHGYEEESWRRRGCWWCGAEEEQCSSDDGAREWSGSCGRKNGRKRRSSLQYHCSNGKDGWEDLCFNGSTFSSNSSSSSSNRRKQEKSGHGVGISDGHENVDCRGPRRVNDHGCTSIIMQQCEARHGHVRYLLNLVRVVP